MTKIEKEELGTLWPRVITTIVVFLILLFIVLFIKKTIENSNEKEDKTLITALNDTIKVWKNKDGINTFKIENLVTSNTSAFLTIRSQKTDITRLQKEVLYYKSKLKKKGSITVVGTQGSVEGTFVNTNTGDDSCPIYNSDFNFGGWIWGSTVASNDSTKIKIKYKEDLTLALFREKSGFLGLGRGIPYAEVKLLNPYSSVSSLRTYQVSEPKLKRFGFGPGLFYGIGPNFETGVFVGLGLSWDLIQF